MARRVHVEDSFTDLSDDCGLACGSLRKPHIEDSFDKEWGLRFTFSKSTLYQNSSGSMVEGDCNLTEISYEDILDTFVFTGFSQRGGHGVTGHLISLGIDDRAW